MHWLIYACKHCEEVIRKEILTTTDEKINVVVKNRLVTTDFKLAKWNMVFLMVLSIKIFPFFCVAKSNITCNVPAFTKHFKKLQLFDGVSREELQRNWLQIVYTSPSSPTSTALPPPSRECEYLLQFDGSFRRSLLPPSAAIGGGDILWAFSGPVQAADAI
uniref:Uncharacterized protein n=1 Tax=Nelumbo nucifera TaxID=4432 RepID=A0A822XMS9_NELNU|nr:TPA_asm: hypothetical protein HUJ06_020291 [Nelumbo nucifera]